MPVKQGTHGSGGCPIRLHSGVLDPVDSDFGFLIEDIYRVIRPMKRGLDAIAVKTPKITPISEGSVAADWRRPRNSGRSAVPETKRKIRRVDRRRAQMFQRRPNVRQEGGTGKTQANSCAGDLAEKFDLAGPLFCFLECAVKLLK